MVFKKHISKGKLAAVITLTINGCTKIFKGWIKRFGETSIFLRSPFNRKEHPNL
jgi:hypothetical protein